MREAEYSGQFKRDVKQAQRRGKDMGKPATGVATLTASELSVCTAMGIAPADYIKHKES